MSKHSILSIDDDPYVQEVIRMICEEDGHICDTVLDIEPAINLLKSHRYRALLLDINIGNRNGAEIIRFLNTENNLNKEIPIIIISGYINKDFIERQKSRFHSILLKPFNTGELKSSINSAIENQSSIELSPITLETFETTETEICHNQVSVAPSPDVTKPFPIDDIKEKSEIIISNIRKTMQKSKLKDLLSKNKSKFASKYAQHQGLIINISIAIAIEIGWNTDKTLEKFIYAAYLHDILIEDNENFIDQDLNIVNKQATLDRKQYFTHPATTADLLDQMPQIPTDVSTIIRQHHELPDGKGFPQKLTQARITPPSAIFIVSHDLANYIQSQEEWSITHYIKKVEKIFNKGKHFISVLEALEKLSKKYNI